MIISHKKKFIFVHVPKTGGTSIEANLCDVIGMDLEKARKSRLDIRWNHLTADDIKYLVGEAVWKEYFVFGFVRNPYDILLSLYSYNMQLRKVKSVSNYPLFQEMQKYDSFKDFILKSDIRFKHFRQFQYLTDGDKLIVDFVGRYESLQSNYNDICNRIGIKPKELPHELKTNHEDWRSEYTLDMKKAVYAANKIDFDTFGYDK